MLAPSFNPVALSIGSVHIYWYGIMYLVGFLSALILGKYRAKQSKSMWNPSLCDDLLTYIALGVILGGRIGYVLFYNFSYYLHNPLEVFMVWKGGMSFHGGFLGVCIAIFLFSRKYKKNYIDSLEFIAPFVPQCIMLGRIGNFINGELWGRHTNVPWGMIFKHADMLPRHPSQLYEAIGEGLIPFIILWIFSQKPRHRGAIGALFGICYAIPRFCIEFFREPDSQLGFIAFGWLTMGQLLTLVFLGVAIALYCYSKTQPITYWKN